MPGRKRGGHTGTPTPLLEKATYSSPVAEREQNPETGHSATVRKHFLAKCQVVQIVRRNSSSKLLIKYIVAGPAVSVHRKNALKSAPARRRRPLSSKRRGSCRAKSFAEIAARNSKRRQIRRSIAVSDAAKVDIKRQRMPVTSAKSYCLIR